MTNEIPALLEGAARAAGPVVHGVREEQLGDPTPCSEYDVRALLDHLMHVVVSFRALAAKGEADFSTTPRYVLEDGGWRSRFDTETARLVEAWAAPGALEGTSRGMGMPQRTVAGMVLGDLTVHAWDVARATGQDFTPHGPSIPVLLDIWRELAPMGRKMGVFGEPFPVPEDASGFVELLGLSGRDPGWRPPAAG